MRIADNNNRFVGGYSLEGQTYSKEDLVYLSRHSIKKLVEEENLLVFPHSFDMGESSQKIIEFEQSEQGDKDRIYTGNMMGFVGKNETSLTIYSRFDTDENNYFLHYMLQRINSLNVFDLPTNSNKDNIWDFLLYFFPLFLKKAIAQGVYKEYQHKECNDANIKGRVDINRHIRKNIPFVGNVAYSMREHSADNPVTELIRHCIEYMRVHPIGRYLLNNDPDIKVATTLICNVTSRYNLNDRQKVLVKNKRPINHPYFSNYRPLQELCISILTHKKHSFGNDKKKVHGLLFDGAWLWEEYLAKILSKEFKHHTTKGTRIYLFENNIQWIIPDYVHKSNKIIADAKYIPLDRLGKTLDNERATSIYYKTIAYMFRFNATIGYLFYPIKEDVVKNEDILNITDTQSSIIKLGFRISKATEYSLFCSQMESHEIDFRNHIKLLFPKKKDE